jgi:ADP-ribose pyrophosphatase
MIKEWEILDSRIDKDYKVFQIQTKQARSPRTAKVGTFYTIDADDWVNVIPLTDKGEVVMIRQYRHGSKEVTLEIPGGVVEEASPEAAALRELAEETGYCGDSVTYLGATNPNPAIFTNLCHTYLVENARKVADLSLDVDEDIDVELVPLHQVPSLIRNGTVSHALVIVAFQFYYLHRS